MSATVIVRLTSSPPLSAPMIDDLRRRFTTADDLLVCVIDSDLNVSVLSFRSTLPALSAALTSLFEKIGAGGAVGRAFRLELQTSDASASLPDEIIRSIAVEVHGALRSPVHVARRLVPAGAWQSARAMGWGQEGLGTPQNASMLPYGGSESLGVAIEIGPALILMKVQLAGVADMQLTRVLSAVSGPESGFADVAAYAVGAQRNERAFAVLEFSDVKRTPPARVLNVLQIEANRYGGRLGLGAFLSHVPLQSVLDTLALQTGLRALPAQIIETHLRAAAHA